MSQFKWLICAALFGMMPSAGLAQQEGPAAAQPDNGNVRVVPELLTAPLPAAGRRQSRRLLYLRGSRQQQPA